MSCFLRFLLLLGLVMPALHAERLTTTNGSIIDGDISGLYGHLLSLRIKGSPAITNVNTLDDASLLKVASFLEKTPPLAPSWSASVSKVAKATAKRLQILRNGKLVAFDPGSRPEPEFYLVYFGAYWCGPCRNFSPRLVEAYRRLKAAAPDRFEVIFLSSDTDSGEQLRYVREVNMPWPVVKYASAQGLAVFEQWRARGIPCLVVLTREGDLLFHSYRGEEYLGADDPLEKFTALLADMAGAAAPNAENHRLAVAQHIHTAGTGDRSPAPYLVTLSANRQRALGVTQIDANITIDAKGHVTDVEFSPQLGAAADDMLRREAENWLFLPAVKQGSPCKAVLKLPIALNKS